MRLLRRNDRIRKVPGVLQSFADVVSQQALSNVLILAFSYAQFVVPRCFKRISMPSSLLNHVPMSEVRSIRRLQ